MVNTITTYRSPLRLIAYTAEDINSYSTQAISRARKKMMAEIALADGELTLDGVSYSRNDASTLLDDISETDWRLHRTIWAEKGLLNFLEQETFDAAALQPAKALSYDPRFVQAVSPYFAHSFNIASGRLLKAGDFDGLKELLAYQGFILPEYSHEAFQKLREYFEDLSYTLRNLSWEKFQADESVLHFVFSESWQAAANALPSSFATMRDDVVEQVIGIVIRFQHKATWYYLHRTLQELGKLETNDFNRSEIERIGKVMHDNSRSEGNQNSTTNTSSGDSPSVGRMIWWGIWLVLIIVRVATCANKQSSSSSNSYLPDYSSSDYSTERINKEEKDNYSMEKRNESLFVSFLDSLSAAGGSPTEPQRMVTGDQPLEGLAQNLDEISIDSALIINNTGRDAMLIYCKDIYGHQNSGRLPMMYAGFIKKGDSTKVAVEPDNGRIYFAFGTNWGELKKPLQVSLDVNSMPLNNQSISSKSSLILSHFFGKPAATQTLLRTPLQFGFASTTTDQMTRVTLFSGTDGFGWQSNNAAGARLTVSSGF